MKTEAVTSSRKHIPARSKDEHGATMVEYVLSLSFILLLMTAGIGSLQKAIEAKRQNGTQVVTIGPCGGVLTAEQCK